MRDGDAARREIFAREFAATLNGAQSAITAGYSPKAASSKASQLLTEIIVKTRVTELLAERHQKIEINALCVLQEIARCAFANMGDYITVNAAGDAYIDLSKLTREQSSAIQEITVDVYTEGRGEEAREVKRTKLKLVPKTPALEMLGRHLLLFKEREEAAAAGGNKIEIVIRSVAGEATNVQVIANQVEAHAHGVA